MYYDFIKNNDLLTLEELIKKRNPFFYKQVQANNDNVFELPSNLLINEINRLRDNQRDLKIIVPHYQSSFCADDCGYCGFRRSNAQMFRTRLSDEDFVKELNLLIDWGYRVIELVYSTDPSATPEVIAKRVDLTFKVGKQRGVELKVGLNANVFSAEGYRTLQNAGVDFFVVWMETYSEDIYKKWHRKGTPKYSFENRLNSYERAIEGGLKKFGMAVLYGLNDWKQDFVSLMNHALYLSENYGISPYIFGAPRIKHTMKVDLKKFPYAVTDDEMTYILHLYRILFPETMIFFNTREEYEFNAKNIIVGGDLFTIDCATFPGAYLKESLLEKDIRQFKTFLYSRNTISDELKQDYILKYSW